MSLSRLPRGAKRLPDNTGFYFEPPGQPHLRVIVTETDDYVIVKLANVRSDKTRTVTVRHDVPEATEAARDLCKILSARGAAQ